MYISQVIEPRPVRIKHAAQSTNDQEVSVYFNKNMRENVYEYSEVRGAQLDFDP